MKKSILLAPLVLLVAVPLVLWGLGTRTAMRVESPVRVVGTETPVTLLLANPHGVRRVSAYLEQNGKRFPVHEETRPVTRLRWSRQEAPSTVRLTVGKSKAPELTDGKARLVLEAQANDFRGATDRLAFDVDVNTRPPSVTADSLQHYINQGGSELVTFTASGYWTEAGVRVGPYTFRSFPLPGKPETERFALFAYPWDVPAGTEPVVFVRNPAGAEATATFWNRTFPKQFRVRDLEVPDSFLQKVVSELDPQGSGALLPRFLKINGEMRRRNNQALADLREKSQPKALWSGPFRQLGNSKVEAQFADVRSYQYQGKKVDQQVHLGFDLSVTKNVGVVASNSGVVVHAAPLGIYGNCVVVDHGYGLQSIYAHLSEIGVKDGQTVARGDVLGKSGMTGLAGGDHLHFSMQVDGVQINPVEWWDEHWIRDRILTKLPMGKS